MGAVAENTAATEPASSSRATIRRAVEADLPRIVTMCGAFLTGTLYGRHLPFREEQLESFAAFVLERGVVFVAEMPEDGLVGFIAGAYGDEPIAGVRMLDELAWWLEPSYRSGRTGYYLLRTLEAWARDEGLSMMTMKAPTGSELASFYIRTGYEPIETTFLKRL